MLYGRGTTDCLGHVALITELLCQVQIYVFICALSLSHVRKYVYPIPPTAPCPAQLAERKVSLKRTLIVVFIANEVRDTHTSPPSIDRLAVE